MFLSRYVSERGASAKASVQSSPPSVYSRKKKIQTQQPLHRAQINKSARILSSKDKVIFKVVLYKTAYRKPHQCDTLVEKPIVPTTVNRDMSCQVTVPHRGDMSCFVSALGFYGNFLGFYGAHIKANRSMNGCRWPSASPCSVYEARHESSLRKFKILFKVQGYSLLLANVIIDSWATT